MLIVKRMLFAKLNMFGTMAVVETQKIMKLSLF